MIYPIVIILGSDSDLPVFNKFKCIQILDAAGVEFKVQILSAHRHKEDLNRHVLEAVAAKTRIFIAAASMNAALSGNISSTIVSLDVPNAIVSGVPLSSAGQFDNALLATVRNPSGIPVGCTGIDSSGFDNAAIMACQIVGMNDLFVAKNLAQYLRKNRKPPQPDYIVSDKRRTMVGPSDIRIDQPADGPGVKTTDRLESGQRESGC